MNSVTIFSLRVKSKISIFTINEISCIHFNSVQFYIIYVRKQGQLQAKRNVDTGNYIMHNNNNNSFNNL
jgi:hypothetical protein